MRKSKTFELIRKASGTALLLGGLGFMGASSASAATPDVVFANHGDNLVAQIQQVNAECAAPAAADCACPTASECAPVADSTCAAPDACATGNACGAGDACGAGGACDVNGGCGNGGCNGGCDGGLLGDCCLGDPWRLNDQGVEIGGWVQFGYHSESTGLFNSHPDRFNLHQLWFYAEKAADGSKCDWDWGFRADLMYGVDAADTQAFGNNPGRFDFQNGLDHGIYGWAIPQLYMELAKGDWTVTLGHFYTLVGYEVVTAPDNFFYSHAKTMFNSEPFTHTGVLASYAASCDTEIYAGWTAGWDTGFDRNNDGDASDGSNFIGGISTALGDDVSLTYITTVGDFGTRAEGYSHSVVVDVALADNLNYVFQTDLVDTNAASNSDQYGINQYLIYSINDCLAAGARVEWWRNDGTSEYDATFGLNIRPCANLVIRPEVRHDWTPASDFEQTSFGIDAIFTF